MKKLTRFFIAASLASIIAQPIFAADNSANAANQNLATTSTTQDNTTTNSTANTTTNNTTAPAKKSISMSNLLLQLQKAGYIVKSVEFDRDNATFKVDAIDKHGESQNLDLNGTTGLTAEQKKSSHEVPMAQAVKKLEKNGTYTKSVTADATSYKATVVDNKGNSQDFTIDRQTGKVTQ